MTGVVGRAAIEILAIWWNPSLGQSSKYGHEKPVTKRRGVTVVYLFESFERFKIYDPWPISLLQIVLDIQPGQFFFVGNMEFWHKPFGVFHRRYVKVHETRQIFRAKRERSTAVVTESPLYAGGGMVDFGCLPRPSPLRVWHTDVGGHWCRTLSSATFAMAGNTPFDRCVDFKTNRFTKTSAAICFSHETLPSYCCPRLIH